MKSGLAFGLPSPYFFFQHRQAGRSGGAQVFQRKEMLSKIIGTPRKRAFLMFFSTVGQIEGQNKI